MVSVLAQRSDATEMEAAEDRGGSPLLDLPEELLLHILSFLPAVGALALSCTSRCLYNIVDDGSKSDWSWESFGFLTHRPSMSDLLIIEQWPRFHDYFGCAHCNKMRHCSNFAPARVRSHYRKCQRSPLWLLSKRDIARALAANMMDAYEAYEANRDMTYADYMASLPMVPVEAKIKALPEMSCSPSRQGRESQVATDKLDKSSERMCIDCSLKSRIYGKGELLRFPTKMTEDNEIEAYGTGVVCKRCGLFKVCDADSPASLRRTCDDCLEYRPRGRHAGKTWQQGWGHLAQA